MSDDSNRPPSRATAQTAPAPFREAEDAFGVRPVDALVVDRDRAASGYGHGDEHLGATAPRWDARKPPHRRSAPRHRSSCRRTRSRKGCSRESLASSRASSVCRRRDGVDWIVFPASQHAWGPHGETSTVAAPVEPSVEFVRRPPARLDQPFDEAMERRRIFLPPAPGPDVQFRGMRRKRRSKGPRVPHVFPQAEMSGPRRFAMHFRRQVHPRPRIARSSDARAGQDERAFTSDFKLFSDLHSGQEAEAWGTKLRAGPQAGASGRGLAYIQGQTCPVPTHSHCALLPPSFGPREQAQPMPTPSSHSVQELPSVVHGSPLLM